MSEAPTAARSFVSVGRRRIRVEVAGSGPTVLLDTGGAGQGVGNWPTLVDPLSEFATVVSYDRAGIGESDARPTPDTVAAMADDLNALLHNLGVALPAALVGWSYGGLVASLYAARFPWNVCGLVFIDPTPTERAPHFRLGGVWQRSVYALSTTGLVKTSVGERLARHLLAQSAMSREEADGFVLFMRERHAVAAQQRTLAKHERNRHEIEAVLADRGLPPVPLTVITAGKRPRNRKMDSMTDWMTASHERLAARSPRGRVVTADESTHSELPTKQPEVVIAAVRAALEMEP